MGGWVSRGPFSTLFQNSLYGFWKPNNQFKSIQFFHLFGWGVVASLRVGVGGHGLSGVGAGGHELVRGAGGNR